MEKDEIWISDFWGGKHGVILGNRVGPNTRECVYLIKIRENQYAIDRGGRVSTLIDSGAVYTGDGLIYESEFSKFYHKSEGIINIVPLPEDFYGAEAIDQPQNNK